MDRYKFFKGGTSVRYVIEAAACLIFVALISNCQSEPPTPSLEPTVTRTQEVTDEYIEISTPTLFTPTVSYTQTPGVGVDTFSNSSWLTIPPEDILEQLAYPGIGGGIDNGNICMEPSSIPEFVSMHPERIELFSKVTYVVCGLSAGENVIVTVSLPNEEDRVEEQIADASGGLIYQFSTVLGDPAGTYRIEFVDKGGSVATEIQVVEPDGPRVIELEDNQLLLLYNFAPFEQVRLIVYRYEINVRKLFAWQEFQVDPQGRLLVEMDLPVEQVETPLLGDYEFYVIGEETQTRHDDQIRFSCPGAMKTRLAVGMRARPAPTNTQPLRVHAEPGLSKPVVTQITTGSQFFISGGPLCVDGVVWWQTSIDGVGGWIVEGEDGEYYVEPEYKY